MGESRVEVPCCQLVMEEVMKKSTGEQLKTEEYKGTT